MAAEYIGREDGGSNSASRKVAVASGVTVTSGDFVTLSSGKVTTTSISKKRLLGFVMGGDTENIARSKRVANTGVKTALGNAGGTVKVLVNQEPSAKYLVQMASGNAAATDEGKYFNLMNNAQSTITSTGVALTNGDTITIGGQTYTFQTSLVDAANNILIGASASVSLDNLKSAINGSAGGGTTYGTATVANASVTATTKTATTLLLESKDGVVTYTVSDTAVTLSSSAVIGGTGSQRVVNTAVADLGQLILVKAAPLIRGTDATYGIFRLADTYARSEAALV